ncbi:MAG: peptidyl-prolyl cis-trans isomerase [Candidatus Eisenbacteria bacterium]
MRTILWTAASAAVLFAVACGNPTPSAESPPSGDPADDLVLAKVGDREIQVRDLLHKIQVQLPAMAEATGVQDVRQKRQVLSQMVDQYCWVLLAEENGWDQDPEFRAILELSRKYILANHAAQMAVYSEAQPTPEEIGTYYRENADQFRIPPVCKASHIVVETEGEAREIQRLLRGGADFGELAKERSVDRTARSGGLLGTIAENIDIKGYGVRPDLAKMILALPDGSVSEPTLVERGYALFTAYEHEPETVRPLSEVQSTIQDILYKKKANELFAENLAQIRKDANVEVYDTAFVQYAVHHLSDVEIQALATAEHDPKTKIAYFEGLLKEHPTSTIAPQAQFMIGFIQADELREFGPAKAAFEQMVQKYPDDELVDSARWMLANMDKDLEQDPQLEQIRLLSRQKRKSR